MIERRWRSGRDRGRPKYDVRERDEGRGGMGGGGGGGGDGTTTATQPRSPQPGGGGGVRNLGKTVQLAARYRAEGADENAFLNITSSSAPGP